MYTLHSEYIQLLYILINLYCKEVNSHNGLLHWDEVCNDETDISKPCLSQPLHDIIYSNCIEILNTSNDEVKITFACA